MKRTLVCLSAVVLAGCSVTTSTSITPNPDAAPDASATTPTGVQPDDSAAASAAHSVDAYKVHLAQRISQRNAARVYEGRPQALLRSVIVLRYTIDRNGNLVHSEIMRSNRDRANEQTALASLKASAPFPRPASHLLRQGRLEVSESWLFNNDGRFQLRSIAQAQMTE